MIKDDFEYEGPPNPNIWVSNGNPSCHAGKLNLSASDLVRSKNPMKLDEGAKVVLKISSGDGNLYISNYPLTFPPDSVEGIPYYKFGILNFRAKCNDQNGPLGELAGVYPPFTLEVESLRGELYFYATGLDWQSNPIPRTLVAKISNQFFNKDVYLYLVGGNLSVDSIEASSGSENPMTLAILSISQLVYVVPVLLFIIVIRQIVESVKGIKED